MENALNRPALWLACRRHIQELHIKHVAKVVAKEIGGRNATGPTEPLFKRFQDSWPELGVSELDQSNLRKFDWQKVAGKYYMNDF